MSTVERKNWRPLLLWLVFCACMLSLTHRSYERDRWGRDDLARDFPATSDATPLLLVNEGTIPVFFEIRSRAWETARPELLLPGESQFVDVPDGDWGECEVVARRLDPQDHGVARLIPLPAGWNLTDAEIGADGAIETTTMTDRGDLWPRRGMFGISTSYALPVRVGMPWDAHERPPAKNIEHESWIGPGTRTDTDVCAFALEREPVVNVWVPRLDAAVNSFVLTSETGATRITAKPDGSFGRDGLPLWKRCARLASF